jgi:hypothetical protein
LPPDISSGSIVDITVSRNHSAESAAEAAFRRLQDSINASFGASSPSPPVLRCRNATQTSVVLEWDPISLATADLVSLSLYRNGNKAGNIPRPLAMHSTKISGLAVDTEYTFHLVLRTTAGTYKSEEVTVRTHKMTDLSGITITTGILPAATREALASAVDRIGAKIVDGVRIDTTHFVTTEGRGVQWEKAVENNIPVVRPEWVEACERNGRILGVTKFYLDAVRPGPEEMGVGRAASMSVSSPAPAPAPQTTQKELPQAPKEEEPPAGPTIADAPAVEPPAGPTAAEGPGVESEKESDDEREEREKVRAGGQGEQKVRADEREKENLAVRPKQPTAESEDDEGEVEEDGEEQTGDKLEVGGKSPGDGASMQDVPL